MTKEEAVEFLIGISYDLGTIGVESLSVKDGKKMRDAIKTLELEPRENCINRAELLKAIDTWDKFGVDDTNLLFRLDNLSLPHYVPYIHYDDVIKCIKGMSSVTPKQKMGHWIGHKEHCEKLGVMPSGLGAFKWCSNCDCGIDVKEWHRNNYNYCPNCGVKMINLWEGEE